MRAIAVIPARYASTRFPGKLLAPLAGKALILHAWENAKQARSLDRVIVAADDERIASVVADAGGEVVMTSPDCPSGTDRVAEAVRGEDVDWVVNIQGDEPLLPGAEIDRWLGELGEASMSTLARRMAAGEPVTDPNLVKVVIRGDGHALYFSRYPIPYVRDDGENPPAYFHHLGVYAYRKEVLLQLVDLPRSPLERAENLEQLRALENGFSIQVVETRIAAVGVDTPEDLVEAEKMLHTSQKNCTKDAG